MQLRTEHAYDALPVAVFEMLSDPAFLRAKLEALGHRDIEVVECDATADGGARIVTRRTVPLDVPGVLRKVINPANTVVQTDQWGPAHDDGTRDGTWEVDAKGVPVAIRGTMRLVVTPGGCTEPIEGTAKSSVPLVGGKLEKFIGDNTLGTLAREYEFARGWLKG